MDLKQADGYFEGLFQERWGRFAYRWWGKFNDRRYQWEAIYTNAHNLVVNYNSIEIKLLETYWYWLPVLLKYKNELFGRRISRYYKTVKSFVTKIELDINTIQKKMSASSQTKYERGISLLRSNPV